ncbi:hypothetical protein SEUBUCD646_0L03790 [Saccharomyces eubayanus]|uniref:RanBD1 domain-containing protein n=2 Tax=Saccharomyces TaxID=4930 RepID=A0A6C1ECB2_SACPS|nr:hypothetical protein GRS66_009543 [Saccharomyces pastorianus]CAI1598344.1 hypothetical protein SEUBUCD650_0L03780 [Saccharomyces eubayanus]CAI1624484.1 hypothetical protein SEUBUCD646_0L03790 [Saccharomyces eubayanus]
MAKRVADAQIQRETYDSNESDDDMNQSTKVASSDVMNRRKIAMPKRRMAFKPLATPASDESKIASSFNPLKQANNSEAKADNDHTTQNNSKLKALNLQFKTKIDELVSSEPLADLRPLLTKYEEYIKSILKASEESTESSKPSIQENGGKLEEVEDDQESSDSSSDEEVKVEGPKFTINSKPITSDSVFSFGTKKEKPKKEESDSESDIEIKGPEFTFSGAVSSEIFKLNPSIEKSDKSDEKSEAAPKPFSFTSTTPSSTTEENEVKNPFSFTASTKKNESDNVNIKPSFTFGAQDVVDTQTKKPTFMFGQTAAKPSQQNSSFTFGVAKNESTNEDFNSKPVNSDDGNETKSSFTFSMPNKNTSDATKPSFSFGASTSSNAASKPGLSFGSVTILTKEANTNDSNNNVEKPISKPAFGFLSNTDSEKNAEKEEGSKPVFSFGKTSENDNEGSVKPVISSGFGSENNNKEAAKPAFSFGKSTATDLDAGSKPPAFTFGSIAGDNKEVTKTDAKQPFSFGTASSNGAPSFSFGNTTNSPPNPSAAPAPAIPSTGFKFSLPFEQKGGQTFSDNKNEESTTKMTPADPKGPSNVDTASEESKPLDLQNGEEDEIALFSQRAKLMTFNSETKSYDSKGVGEIKLLQRKDDPSKVRLLCRSDGMGNILLNATVVESFKYEPLAPENENLIKTPTVAADGKLTTYIIKFKQKAEGHSFTKSIEDVKREMKNV